MNSAHLKFQVQNRLAVEQRQQVAIDVAGRDMSNEVGRDGGWAAKALDWERSWREVIPSTHDLGPNCDIL